ncbi:MAG: hypothetical protein AAB496_02330 [Patescibacteria group bacterium]
MPNAIKLIIIPKTAKAQPPFSFLLNDLTKENIEISRLKSAIKIVGKRSCDKKILFLTYHLKKKALIHNMGGKERIKPTRLTVNFIFNVIKRRIYVFARISFLLKFT